jgi:hypothetical protein
MLHITPLLLLYIYILYLPSTQKHISSIQQLKHDSASSALLQLPDYSSTLGNQTPKFLKPDWLV